MIWKHSSNAKKRPFQGTVVACLFSTAAVVTIAGLLFSQTLILSSEKIPITGELPLDPDDPYAAYFHNILLIVNINYEPVALNTTMFWKRYYSRLFKHVEVISRSDIPEIGVEAAATSYPTALTFWKGTTWGFHYAAIPRMMKRYPNVEGVLWTNDDVVINHWNFMQANKSNLWLPNNSSKKEYLSLDLYPSNLTKPQPRDWAAGSAFQKQARRALLSLPLRYQILYNKSTNGGRVYQKRVCDVFYIPRRFFGAMGNVLLPAVLRQEMMSELGIPLAFLAADNPQNWDRILNDMEYNWELLWGTNRSYDARDHWTPQVSAYHPWKLASTQGKISFLRMMVDFDPVLRAIFPRYLSITPFDKAREWWYLFKLKMSTLLQAMK